MSTPWRPGERAGAASQPGPNRADRPLAPARTGADAPPETRSALDTSSDLVSPATAPEQLKESLERLKVNLVQTSPSPQVIVVTSPAPGEGKSYLALNLALLFAGDGETRALLIDADLRKPGLSGLVRPRPAIGLTEIVAQDADWKSALARLAKPPLSILATGAVSAEPVKILSSRRVRTVLAELRGAFDRIIIDTPPVVPFVDAGVVGELSDGAVIVVRSGATAPSAYRRALAVLDSVRVLGVVLNGTTRNLADRDQYGDKYYYKYYRKKESG